MPNEQISQPRRRYPRFSVRGLILVVLLFGAGLGWTVRRARIQRDAVAAIKKDCRRLSYNWEWREGKSIPGGKPWAPRWLIDLIGIDYFGHVTSITLNRTDITHASLEHLKGLTELTSLHLDETKVTDTGLAKLKGLTKLTSLSLGCTRVTDAGKRRN